MGMVKKRNSEKDVIEQIKRSFKIKKNQDDVLKFNTGHRTRLTINSRLGFIQTLKLLEIYTNKPFKKVTQTDMEKWFDDQEVEQGLRQNTTSKRKILIRCFYKWLFKLKKKGEYPEVVEWFEIKRRKTLPKGLLTKEEVLALIQAATSQRDRAIIYTLYDTAGRIGEIVNMKVGDVTFYSGYAKLRLEGKTGAREVPVVNCIPELQKWLNEHPKNADPNAWLWVNFRSIEHDNVGEEGIRRNFARIVARTDIKKKVYPHLLRHTRITEWFREGYTEQEVKIMAGWTRGSRMVEIYSHLAGEDIEKSFLKKQGLLDGAEEAKEEILKPKPCPRGCKDDKGNKLIYSPMDKFCNVCGAALDLKAAMTLQEEKITLEDQMEEFKQGVKNVNEIFKEMAEIPELKKALAKHFG